MPGSRATSGLDASESRSVYQGASEIENTKIACARKFFDELGRRVSEDRVKYDVVTSYDKLMDIVAPPAS
mgnify:CR=1 FL=1